MKLVSVAIAELSAQRSHELRRQIEGEADIRVIAETDTPNQLLSVVFDQCPDLLVLSAGLLPPPLKSVAYQPVPFSAKPAAEIFLKYFWLPHVGQAAIGASASFCMCSFWAPQSGQAYS